VVAAFAGVARELAVSAQARAASELQRATARAERRTARAQARVIAGAARELTYLAAAMEETAAMQRALAGGREREAKSFGASKHSRAPAKASKPRSRPDASHAQVWRAQERVLREQEARMWQAHQAADQAAAPSHPSPASAPSHPSPASAPSHPSPASAPSHPSPASGGGLGRGGDPNVDRRMNEIAARHDAEPRQRPRIRRLW
jgi:hypothetical protein